MKKDNALQRIDSHEKLCRIMQKQTHDKINKLERQINPQTNLTRNQEALLSPTEKVIAGRT